MTETQRTIFHGMQILNHEQFITEKALVIEAGKIDAIIPAEMIKHHLPARIFKMPRDYYLIPGLIDLHIHGAAGKDVMDAASDALQTISLEIAKEGVTGFLATTMSAKEAQLETVLQHTSQAIEQNVCQGATLLGLHLEGPFLSYEKAGAQPSATLQSPHIEKIKTWQMLASQHIKLMTIAPELPGALDCIQILLDLNIVPAMGHTNATFTEANTAIARGCHYATHLFNAMRSIHHRDPGIQVAVLLSKQVMAEIIVDAFHVDPAMIKLAYEMKGTDQLLLVTDAMRAKCLQDGCYDLGGQTVHVQQQKAALKDGTLAGSTLRLSDALKNMMAFTGCSLAEAVQMAAFNPAKVLGLEHDKGSLSLGKAADLVVLRDDLSVAMTLVADRIVFDANDDKIMRFTP